MWVGSIDKLHECPFLTEAVKSLVVDFIKNNDMQNVSNGRYDLGEENYVNVFEYETKENDGVFEAHKQYIDIHYVITGKEKILWGETYTQEKQPYQPDGDYSLGVINQPKEVEANGVLCVFLQDEPHKAGVICGGISKVKKAVFKLK